MEERWENNRGVGEGGSWKQSPLVHSSEEKVLWSDQGQSVSEKWKWSVEVKSISANRLDR